jgi:hypothetical protein
VQNILLDPKPPPGQPINRENDGYVSIRFDNAMGLTFQAPIQFSYDRETGLITDLAGNLLASVTDFNVIEQTPPEFRLTLAAVDGTRVLVVFSEPVDADPVGFLLPSPANFAIAPPFDTDLTVVDVEPIGTGPTEAIERAWITLDSPVTVDFAVNGGIRPNGANQLFDDSANAMLPTEERRITDVGMGVAEPVLASNDIQVDDVFGDQFAAVTGFDGSGQILDRDFRLDVELAPGVSVPPSLVSLPMQLFYDVDPDTAVVGTGLGVTNDSGYSGIWLPDDIDLVVPRANAAARSVNPDVAGVAAPVFGIDAEDPEIQPGAELQFVLRLGDLPLARVLDPEDPSQPLPWSITIEELLEQRSGVTLLNNVIDPTAGQQALLNYRLTRAGQVTVLVTALDGTAVRILDRGLRGAGDYQLTWDGTNQSGQIVARGVYFIRVVGPDLDESRRVLIVKP